MKFLKRHIFKLEQSLCAFPLNLCMHSLSLASFYDLFLANINASTKWNILQSNRKRLVSTAYVRCCKTFNCEIPSTHNYYFSSFAQKEWNTTPLQYYSVHRIFCASSTLQSMLTLRQQSQMGFWCFCLERIKR